MRAPALVFFGLIGLARCHSLDEPVDCGVPDMALVTFPTQAENVERICVDIHAAARVDATAQSAGVDDSYAVSRPGVYPWTHVTFTEAVAACGRAGKFLCDSRVYNIITPVLSEGTELVQFDMTTIDAVPRNSAQTTVANRLEPVSEDGQLRGLSGKPPYPESTGSVAFWTTVAPKDDAYFDENSPFISGSISGNKAIGGYARKQPLPVEGYKHPLLGFRCCLPAKMKGAFVPLNRDPSRVRKGPDPEVPLAP